MILSAALNKNDPKRLITGEQNIIYVTKLRVTELSVTELSFQTVWYAVFWQKGNGEYISLPICPGQSEVYGNTKEIL